MSRRRQLLSSTVQPTNAALAVFIAALVAMVSDPNRTSVTPEALAAGNDLANVYAARPNG